jgi:hypothetical protein
VSRRVGGYPKGTFGYRNWIFGYRKGIFARVGGANTLGGWIRAT